MGYLCTDDHCPDRYIGTICRSGHRRKVFYGLMPAAAAYVFRPTEKYISQLIFKLTGVSKPVEKE
jgi:hypothetical protein